MSLAGRSMDTFFRKKSIRKIQKKIAASAFETSGSNYPMQNYF
jgi:uncharacterized membrane protein